MPTDYLLNRIDLEGVNNLPPVVRVLTERMNDAVESENQLDEYIDSSLKSREKVAEDIQALARQAQDLLKLIGDLGRFSDDDNSVIFTESELSQIHSEADRLASSLELFELDRYFDEF